MNVNAGGKNDRGGNDNNENNTSGPDPDYSNDSMTMQIREGEEVGFFFLRDTNVTLLFPPQHSSPLQPTTTLTESKLSSSPLPLEKELNSNKDLAVGGTRDLTSASTEPINTNSCTNSCSNNSSKSLPSLQNDWMDVGISIVKKNYSNQQQNDADDEKLIESDCCSSSCSMSGISQENNPRGQKEDEDGKKAEIPKWKNSNNKAKKQKNEIKRNTKHPPKSNVNECKNSLCHRCNIILDACSLINSNNSNNCSDNSEMIKSSGKIQILLPDEGENDDKSYYFDGYIDDTKCQTDTNRHDSRGASGTSRNKNKSNSKKTVKRRRQLNQKYQNQQRSDAAILLGTILRCRDDGFIRIENFQILFPPNVEQILQDHETWEKEHGEKEEENCNEGEEKKEHDPKNNHNTTRYQQIKCSIVITVSLPHLEIVSKEAVSLSKSSQAVGGKQQQVTMKKKCDHYDEYLTTDNTSGFPPHGQFLFSLMRSDWSWLDHTMEQLKFIYREAAKSSAVTHVHTNNINNSTKRVQGQSNNNNNNNNAPHHNTPSIFPSTISLEELYTRIRGASIQNEEYSGSSTTGSQSISGQDNNNTANIFSALPSDVLQINIAPYLRAKSLHNLRMTCQFLYHLLIPVVPGMKLRLFKHQVRSLLWMRQRETSHLTDDDSIQQRGFKKNNYLVGDNILCGDLYRSVTCGSMISASPRRPFLIANNDGISSNNHGIQSGKDTQYPFWHINTWTGGCSLDYRNERIRTVARCRNLARGGLLCDDPGLGKTITILSLILQTFGQSTELTCSNSAEKRPQEITDDLIVDTYWRENLVSCTRREELNVLCRKLQKFDLEQYFQYPVETNLPPEQMESYFSLIESPLCLEDVKEKVQNDVYVNTLKDFVQDIQMIYSNAKRYNPPDSIIHERAKTILLFFDDMYEEFRKKQLKHAISSQKRSKNSLGALVLENRRRQLLDTLLSSKGTLLVVPSTLIEHWEDQMKMHVDFSACSKNKLPLIYRHRANKKFKRNHSIREVSDIFELKQLCKRDCTHYPLLFIDECTDKLPSEDILAMFYIVLTTTKRLTLEWKHGSFEEELRKGKVQGTSYRSFNYDVFDEHGGSSPCPLLKVHWLRLVVDEGHSMGKKGAPTNAIDFCSWITAQYRWAITGTPTPQTTDSGVRNLFGLLKFLKHDYFSTLFWGEERCKALSRGLESGNLACFSRLQHLLNLFMVRHTKRDVERLHKPVFIMTRTDMSSPETRAYDTLVSAVQMNLITTSMKGKTSGLQDSLLNVRQKKHAKQALSNIRLACSGGTSVVPTLTQENWTQTIQIMRETHKATDVQVQLVNNFLHRMSSEELTGCMSCGLELQTLFLLPCCCQICTECMNPKNSTCPSCSKDFDIDHLQKLQPGLEYTWKWNIEEANKERERQRIMTESLQISTAAARTNQDRNNNEHPQAVPVANEENVVVANIVNNRHRNRRRDAPHVCTYPETFLDGRCKICFEIHTCNFMEGDKKCHICHREVEDCPQDESKFFYITNKLLELWSTYRNRGIDITTGEVKRPLKAIIFSQFRQVLDLVGDRLIRRFGYACVAQYWGAIRNSDLERFTKSDDCFCMLLSKEGSHGLDLSFVTHIFFMDEIFDKSLESQVVARAYRMGATENVFVEQLVSRHSIEELLVLMNKRDQSDDTLYSNTKSMEDFKSDYYGSDIKLSFTEDSSNNNMAKAQAKVRYLLSGVKLIRPKPVISRKRQGSQTKTHHDNKRKKTVRFNL